MEKLTAVDLFSGCGGLTLGLKQAGFSVVGAIEVDSLSVETYSVNHPEVHVWDEDIRDVSVSDVKAELGLATGTLSLLAGCPPCQGFSSIRTLNGSKSIADPRNDLVAEFKRFVEGLVPHTVMLENVPALASDRRFSDFLVCLADLDYHYKYEILNASDYGVPQRRRRLILLASKNGPLKFAKKSKKSRTVLNAIGGLEAPGTSSDLLHNLPEKRTPRIIDLIKQIPKDGGSRLSIGSDTQLACHVRCDGFRDVFGRMAWNAVAPTITSGCFNPSKGRFLHPDQDRNITLREAALLQSFPRHYQFSLRRGKTGAAEMIGNAFPPEFVRRHAVRIAHHLRFRLS